MLMVYGPSDGSSERIGARSVADRVSAGIDRIYRRDTNGSYHQEVGADFRGDLPGFDFRDSHVDDSGVAPLTLDDLERAMRASHKPGVLMPPLPIEAAPRRFLSRFRTRRHA